MRKLTKQSLDELAKVIPVISEDEQRRYVGGTDNSDYQVITHLNNTKYDGAEGFYINVGWDSHQGQFCTRVYSRYGEPLYKFY
jgi:hypothetical protein